MPDAPTWRVLLIAACVSDDHEECKHQREIGAAPFCYTVGLDSPFGARRVGPPKPLGYELWVSCLGTCGHRVDMRSAGGVLSLIARQLIADNLPDRTVTVPFETGDLVFTVGEPLGGRRELLQTYQAGWAEIAVVEWRCCP